MILQGPNASGQPVFSSQATPSHKIGTLRHSHITGQRFRYVLAGAVDLVVGNVLQSEIIVENHDQLTPSAAAIGDRKITLTLGATLSAANQYAGGLAIIDTTPGEGYSYVIEDHLAIGSGAAGVMNLHPQTRIQVALTSSSRVTLQPNPYSKVIQAPVSTGTGQTVGVAVFIIAATEYGWICSGGVVGALCQGTPAINAAVTGQASAAGAFAIHSAALPVIGYSARTGVDGKILPVRLTID